MKADKFFPIKTATACPLKWSWSTLYLNQGETKTCHRTSSSRLTPENFNNFHNTDIVIAARKKMLDGKWPSSDNNKYDENACGYCRKIEDSGGLSDRQYQLTIPNLVPPELENDPNAIFVSPTILEVFFNNKCNLACNYCGGNLSSKIEAENKKWGYFKKGEVQISPNKESFTKKLIPEFWKWFEKNSHTLKRLHILGGEPFFQTELDNLIEIIDKNPIPNCIINIVSNLNIKHEKLKFYIEKIKKLILEKKIARFDLTCSIDCWGPQQEYVRFGLKLNTWEKNFLYLLSEKWIYININSVISPLTIKTMPELFQKINNWKKTRKIHQHFTGVVGEKWMKADIFGKGIFTEDFNKILNAMTEDNEEEINIKSYLKGIFISIDKCEKDEVQIENFMIYLKEKDRRRGTDYKTVFPWLIEFDKD